MQPNDFRPITFYSGVSKIADKAGGVNLIPLAFRYEFVAEQRPEAFISLGKAKINKSGEDIKLLTTALNNTLVTELDLLKSKVVNLDFKGFNTILKGKSSRNKTLDNIYGRP
jgi:hypothetical protein